MAQLGLHPRPGVDGQELVDLVIQRLLSAHVPAQVGPQEVHRGALHSQRFEVATQDELYPVMSPEFWKSHRRPSKPNDLVGLRLLHDRDPDAAWGEWRSVHGPEKLDVLKGPRFTSTDLVLRAAASGQGVALARHQLAMEDVTSGRLLRPLGALTVVLDDAYWIVLPRHKLPTPATRSVIEWLKREAAA